MILVYCRKGFALIEFSLSLLTSISIAVFFLTLLYTALGRLWLNQATYDSVICLAQGEPRGLCEDRLVAKARWVGASLLRSKWRDSNTFWELRAEWSLSPTIKIKTQRSIQQGAFY